MSERRHLEPIPIQGLADYHVHCDYSIDAEGSIDEYCEAALQRNLAEICFTTHYDSNPSSASGPVHVNSIRLNGEVMPITPDLLEHYVADVHRAHERYYPMGLSVKLGLEFGWFDGGEESLTRLKDRFDFDYVLCGIHELDDLCFCCEREYERCFARYSPEEMAERYFRDAVTAIRTGLFDAIAHLDYYKKYGERVYGAIIHDVHKPFLGEVFGALVATDTVMEINTSALRKGFPDYFPSAAIVNEARRAGVNVTKLGSDAHKPVDVGFDFEAASALAPPFIIGCDD